MLIVPQPLELKSHTVEAPEESTGSRGIAVEMESWKPGRWSLEIGPNLLASRGGGLFLDDLTQARAREVLDGLLAALATMRAELD